MDKCFQDRGVDVIVSTLNVCSLEETRLLVTETNGKPIGGIFHLAMVRTQFDQTSPEKKEIKLAYCF